MKKILLLIFISGVASTKAQTTTVHNGNGAVLTVTKNSLLSNIGGMETFGTGKADGFGAPPQLFIDEYHEYLLIIAVVLIFWQTWRLQKEKNKNKKQNDNI